ncbi:MAG: hypothetical protein QM784_25250 [Polyangiaceae bacterium]
MRNVSFSPSGAAPAPASSLFAVALFFAGCVDTSQPENSALGGSVNGTTPTSSTNGGQVNGNQGTSKGGMGGSPGTNMTSNSGGTATQGNCGTLNTRPLGCDFAWGGPNSNDASSTLDFVSTWVGYEARGGLDGACDGCRAASQVANAKATLVYYTYFIGYQANLMGGFGDCNVDMSDGHNLCSDGAQWIRDNRALIVEMYANYAKKTYEQSPSKPVIWWLEGDYVQYSYSKQSNPLSMSELGALARDITCAIKSNMPNAVVGMNHSPWISNEQANAFWSAQPIDVLDLVWVQGPGNTGTLVNSGEYNATTANYAWLKTKTGRPIMAETSYAGNGQDDRWTTASVANINQRVQEGVIAVLVNKPSSNYASTIASLSGISSICQ